MRRETQQLNKALSVESIAYSHGLFCASHPGPVILVVVMVIILCSLPFFVTTSGDLNSPKTWKTQWLNYRSPVTMATGAPQWIINDPTKFSARTPSWFVGVPLAVIQQIYVRLKLDCSVETELCHRSQYSQTRITASHLTSKMEDTIEICRPVLHPAALDLSHTLTTPPTQPPHISQSGILSPSLDLLSNKWDKNHNSTLGYHSLKELLYGGYWEQEHQLSRKGGAVGGNDQQQLFALTFVLKPSWDGFNNLTKCLDALQSKWPRVTEPQEDVIQHFYFEPEWRLRDFAPLIAVYTIVFLYISFSVGKIDLVKSKIGLGITACLTVVASLTMSLGICTFFGVSITLSGSEIYPYVVIIIGLENILIIVKAVISTPEELEVKYRIAVGLSKEGWAILQNLLTLLCIMTLSMLVFNYTMREFCVIALVGVLCDSFLQLIFFTTVLSIDLRRLELSDLNSQPLPDPRSAQESPGGRGPCPCPSSFTMASSKKLRSKRIKFFYFLARVRPVSRLLMVALSVVLVAWFTNTETFHNMLTGLKETAAPTSQPEMSAMDHLNLPHLQQVLSVHVGDELNELPSREPINQDQTLETEGKSKSDFQSGSHFVDSIMQLNDSDVFVRRVRSEGVSGVMGMWRKMITIHWPRLLQYAGFCTEGRFLTLLPPISLSLRLGSSPPPSSSQTPTPTLPHILVHPYMLRGIFIIILSTSATAYIAFLIRSSRQRHHMSIKSVRMRKHSSRVACLKGHTQDIDCMCVDGDMVVSVSLDGDIRVWDSQPRGRRCLRTIVRSELCGEPPLHLVATDTSNRPATDGCEDNSDYTPSTTPLFKSNTTIGSSCNLPSTIHTSSLLHNISAPTSILPNAANFPYLSHTLSRSHTSSVIHHSDSPLPVGSTPPVSMNNFPHLVNYTPQVQYNSSVSGSSNSVQVVSATRVTPTPHQTYTTCPVLQPTNNYAGTQPYTTAQGQSVGIPRHTSAYAAVQPQYVNEQIPASGVQAYTQTYPTPYTTPQNTSYPRHTTSSSASTRDTRTHSRALSHGQLSFNRQASTSGRTSLPHISLEVSPPDNIGTSPHSIPTISRSDSPIVGSQGYGFRRNSFQGGVNVQRSLSVNSGLSSSSTKQIDQLVRSSHSNRYLSSDLSSTCASLSISGTVVHSTCSPTNHAATYQRNFSSSPSPILTNQRPGIQVPLEPPMISTSRILPSTPTARNPSLLPAVSTNVHVTAPNGKSESTLACEVPQQSQRVQNIQLTSCSPSVSRSASEKKLPYQRGHARNHSLGNDLPHRGPLFFKGHTRNRSLGSVSGPFQPQHESSRQPSLGNLSIASASSFVTNLQSPVSPQAPIPETGYDFASHFNIFSQYTANMALQYCSVDDSETEPEHSVPTVWCMGTWNATVAVGCGNGQVEAWNADTGSLIFCLNLGTVGVTTITINSQGIFTGHMDGAVNLIGHNGILQKTDRMHTKAISVLRCYDDRVIVGSQDSIVSVLRRMDLMPVSTLHAHCGNIRDILCIDGPTHGCVSGCSKGLIIHWDMDTAELIHDYGEFEGGVIKLGSAGLLVVALLTDCIRVWDCIEGEALHKISLDGLCNDFAVMGSKYVAASLESHIVVYDIDSGRKHSEQYLLPDRATCMTLISHVATLDEASVVCSSGKDLHIVPCQVKLKLD